VKKTKRFSRLDALTCIIILIGCDNGQAVTYSADAKKIINTLEDQEQEVMCSETSRVATKLVTPEKICLLKLRTRQHSNYIGVIFL
jgi:hypothetical protein